MRMRNWGWRSTARPARSSRSSRREPSGGWGQHARHETPAPLGSRGLPGTTMTPTCHSAARLLVLAGLAACAGCARTPDAAKPDTGPPAVKIVTPEKRTLTKYVEQPGIVRAFEEAPLYAKLP